METNFDDSPLSLEFGIFNYENQQLVQHSRIDSHHIEDYVWFQPMPWDVHKSFEKKKMKQQLWKLEERHETDDNSFKQCSSSKVTDHNRLLQQLDAGAPGSDRERVSVFLIRICFNVFLFLI
ncbi:hypothetical protein LINGRAHAP2_LOCUS13416, partial [Linum grandiflorum]